MAVAGRKDEEEDRRQSARQAAKRDDSLDTVRPEEASRGRNQKLETRNQKPETRN
jgi:hypothetical protein